MDEINHDFPQPDIAQVWKSRLVSAEEFVR
jgi:hypothetical protein